MSPIEGSLANLPPVVIAQLESLHAKINLLEGELKITKEQLRDVRPLDRKGYKAEKARTIAQIREAEKAERAPEINPKPALEMNSQEYQQAVGQVTGRFFIPAKEVNRQAPRREPRKVIIHREDQKIRKQRWHS